MLRSLLGNNEWNQAVADANYVRWQWERTHWSSLQQVSSSSFHAIFIQDCMNCACGTWETKADVECSKQMSAKGKYMQVVAKVCRDPA